MTTAVRPPLVRRPDRSPVGIGVCAGIADHLGVAALWVRLAVVVLATTGSGVLVYPIAWLLLPGPSGLAPAWRFRARDTVDFFAYAMVALGVAELVRVLVGAMAWWVGLPIAATVGALVAVYALSRRGRGFGPASAGDFVDALGTRPGRITRSLTGTALVVAGVAALLGTSDDWSALQRGILALFVLFAGLALLLAPWLFRLSSDLIDERRARVRDQERAEMAAHLHDSVLQTLAMVQRRADDPAEVVRLARRQERELRDWLLSGRPTTATSAATIGEAVADLAAELEDLHRVPVEVVQVRDCPIGPRVEVVLQAAREAIVNAQRHAGASVVSVYCEVDDDRITVFVRDRGRGFDLDQVDGDRRGIRESIVQRMERHGGRARVTSAPDAGTEIELSIPRDPR